MVKTKRRSKDPSRVGINIQLYREGRFKYSLKRPDSQQSDADMARSLVVLWAILALASGDPQSKFCFTLLINSINSFYSFVKIDQARLWSPTAAAMEPVQPVEPTATKSCSSGLPDLAWIRANAENLLFLEHLQKQAAEQNLYGWQSQITSQDYQVRLDQIRAGDGLDCGGASCGGGSCDDSMLLERIVALEERLASCGGKRKKMSMNFKFLKFKNFSRRMWRRWIRLRRWWLRALRPAHPRPSGRATSSEGHDPAALPADHHHGRIELQPR